MLEFKEVTIEDKEPLSKALLNETGRGCEYTFGNIFIWQKLYKTACAQENGNYFVRFYDEETPSFLFPVGAGDKRSATDSLIEYCAAEKFPVRIVAASKADCELLEKWYPEKFKYEITRDFAEYVYASEDLIELAGKKYHAKRNHISKFHKMYENNEFFEITRDNIGRVREMNDRWYSENFDGNMSLGQDKATASRAFDFFFDLGFKGGALAVDGKVVAFSMGEPINDEVFCVHEEKAEYEYEGAYTVINQMFSEHFCKGYKFINREDDVGDEGLRKAKLSYFPTEITEKYVVIQND